MFGPNLDKETCMHARTHVHLYTRTLARSIPVTSHLGTEALRLLDMQAAIHRMQCSDQRRKEYITAYGECKHTNISNNNLYYVSNLA